MRAGGRGHAAQAPPGISGIQSDEWDVMGVQDVICGLAAQGRLGVDVSALGSADEGIEID